MRKFAVKKMFRGLEVAFVKNSETGYKNVYYLCFTQDCKRVEEITY